MDERQPLPPGPTCHFFDLDRLPREFDFKAGDYIALIKYDAEFINSIHRIVDGGYQLAKIDLPPDFEEVPIPVCGRLSGQPEHTRCIYLCQVMWLGTGDLDIAVRGGYVLGEIPLPYKKIEYTTAT